MSEESLFAGESKNIEYKVAVPKKSEKYMKTVVAFANGNGGKIVFGIDDKTLEIVGMDEDNIFKIFAKSWKKLPSRTRGRIVKKQKLKTLQKHIIVMGNINRSSGRDISNQCICSSNRTIADAADYTVWTF